MLSSAQFKVILTVHVLGKIIGTGLHMRTAATTHFKPHQFTKQKIMEKLTENVTKKLDC